MEETETIEIELTREEYNEIKLYSGILEKSIEELVYSSIKHLINRWE